MVAPIGQNKILTPADAIVAGNVVMNGTQTSRLVTGLGLPCISCYQPPIVRTPMTRPWGPIDRGYGLALTNPYFADQSASAQQWTRTAYAARSILGFDSSAITFLKPAPITSAPQRAMLQGPIEIGTTPVDLSITAKPIVINSDVVSEIRKPETVVLDTPLAANPKDQHRAAKPVVKEPIVQEQAALAEPTETTLPVPKTTQVLADETTPVIAKTIEEATNIDPVTLSQELGALSYQVILFVPNHDELARIQIRDPGSKVIAQANQALAPTRKALIKLSEFFENAPQELKFRQVQRLSKHMRALGLEEAFEQEFAGVSKRDTITLQEFANFLDRELMGEAAQEFYRQMDRAAEGIILRYERQQSRAGSPINILDPRFVYGRNITQDDEQSTLQQGTGLVSNPYEVKATSEASQDMRDGGDESQDQTPQ